MRDAKARAEAASEGRVRYYTGRPCSHGHDAERYVTNGACVECMRERDREQYRRIVELRRMANERRQADVKGESE